MRTGELYQRYHGLYVATVVDVDDPEKLGRVRLNTDQFDDSDDDPVWAAVARPAGGKDTSVFFTPKVGDQVIIGYIVGDANEPIVIGYAHSKKLPRPSQVDTKRHGIVTNIGRVIFDEDAKKIEVVFTGGAESSITMSPDGIVIESAVKIRVKAPSINLEAQSATMDLDSTGAAIDTGATLMCVNGQAVVLKSFIDQTFAFHTHGIIGPVTGDPTTFPSFAYTNPADGVTPTPGTVPITIATIPPNNTTLCL